MSYLGVIHDRSGDYYNVVLIYYAISSIRYKSDSDAQKDCDVL